jgi:hypothetical protein
MGEAHDLLELVRAGATKDERAIVMAELRRLRQNGHAPPRQLALPAPAPDAAPPPAAESEAPPPAEPPPPSAAGPENVKMVVLEMLPLEVFDAAPPGAYWHLPARRIALAKKGARFTGKHRTLTSCRAAVHSVFAGLGRGKLISANSRSRHGSVTIIKKAPTP